MSRSSMAGRVSVSTLWSRESRSSSSGSGLARAMRQCRTPPVSPSDSIPPASSIPPRSLLPCSQTMSSALAAGREAATATANGPDSTRPSTDIPGPATTPAQRSALRLRRGKTRIACLNPRLYITTDTPGFLAHITQAYPLCRRAPPFRMNLGHPSFLKMTTRTCL